VYLFHFLSQGAPAIFWALESNHPEVVKVLLDAGASLDCLLQVLFLLYLSNPELTFPSGYQTPRATDSASLTQASSLTLSSKMNDKDTKSTSGFGFRFISLVAS
jgi:hypothetical protein